MAPISAVNPAPTLAAKAIPAMSGTTMRVSAKEATTPMKAWAPMPWSELKLSSPTSYPVAELRAKTTKNMPPPTTKAPMPTVTLEISAMISPRCRSARGRLARARPKKANCS